MLLEAGFHDDKFLAEQTRQILEKSVEALRRPRVQVTMRPFELSLEVVILPEHCAKVYAARL